MHYPVKTLALAVTPLLFAVQARFDFDADDVPVSCRTICDPLGQLSRQCDTDLRSDVDRDERLLEAQCICTNWSFDVTRVAALCADCMHQTANQPQNGRNGGDDDDNNKVRADAEDLRDIDSLLATCGFASTQYSPSATSLIQGITVAATAATDISQLTTTLTDAACSTGQSGSSATAGTGASGSTSSTPAGTTASSAAHVNRFSATSVLYASGALLVGSLLLLT